MGTLEPVTLIAPINNSTLYCKNPRILFNLNDGNKLLIIYITLSNSKGIYTYTSTSNPDLFSALAFKPFDKVAFIPNDIAIGENKISIRTYEDGSFSSEQSFIFNYKECLLSIQNTTESISSQNFKYLLMMTNDTLKAYNKTQINMVLPVSNQSKIYRSFFSTINNSLYDLSNWINDSYPGLNRIKSKDIIGLSLIYKKFYNNLLNFIIDL
jgi:hypothetical protein